MNSNQTLKTLRHSTLSLLLAGGFFTSAVETTGMIGAAVIAPAAIYLGMTGQASNSAVAQAHAARLAREAMASETQQAAGAAVGSAS